MTNDTGGGSGKRRRPGRPPKDKRTVLRAFRFEEVLDSGLQAMAKHEGRNLTDQVKFMLEHAGREMGWKLYDLQPAPIEDLYDRLARLEAEVAQLRSVIEKGLHDIGSMFTAAAMPAAAENAAAAPEPISVAGDIYTVIDQMIAAGKELNPKLISAAAPEPISVAGVELIHSQAYRVALPGGPGEVAMLLPVQFHTGVDADDNVVVVWADGTVRKTGLSVDQMLQVIDKVEAEMSGRGVKDQAASIKPKRKSPRS